MSEETSHLLEAFDALPVEEKRVFAREVLHRVLPEQELDGRNEKVDGADQLWNALFLRDPLNLRTGADRAEAFRQWAANHSSTTPPLSDEAISRETIYSTRG